MCKQQIQPGEKVPLKLTAAERRLVLEDFASLNDELKQVIQGTPARKPVMVALADLDDIERCISAEAENCSDKRKQVKLDAIRQKVQLLLDIYMEERPATLEMHAAAPKRGKAKSKADSDTLFQFKITLLRIEPPIWRRIQVQDCTLDKLHEHIQTAMGWTNSHLHQFEIGGRRYGDPQLLDDGFEDFECVDSRRTMISEIVPKSRKRFAFEYEYDFGDGWEHEILFEGCPPVEKGKKYPLCLEGERSCPPEDCGGGWGYAQFLEAIANPKHERHDDMLEWIGGRFDSERFDPKKATREMKKGLPDWRSMW